MTHTHYFIRIIVYPFYHNEVFFYTQPQKKPQKLSFIQARHYLLFFADLSYKLVCNIKVLCRQSVHMTTKNEVNDVNSPVQTQESDMGDVVELFRTLATSRENQLWP